ncbi:MAG TPA: biopolymer transporter ExbD [Polyangiaceae bacterium]|nr:biopolymer transporter ExbD [Polyangiaceae bacterium]
MAAPTQEQGALIQGINVTPLVDVVLVLLIVLMLAASYTVSRALPMQLPRASTGEPAAQSPLAISVDVSGASYVDGAPASLPVLRQKVKQFHAQGGKSALIAADGGTQHRAVVSVIDVLRGEGVGQVAISVAPEDLRP